MWLVVDKEQLRFVGSPSATAPSIVKFSFSAIDRGTERQVTSRKEDIFEGNVELVR